MPNRVQVLAHTEQIAKTIVLRVAYMMAPSMGSLSDSGDIFLRGGLVVVTVLINLRIVGLAVGNEFRHPLVPTKSVERTMSE